MIQKLIQSIKKVSAAVQKTKPDAKYKAGAIWTKDNKCYMICNVNDRERGNGWIAIQCNTCKGYGYIQPGPDQAVVGMKYVPEFCIKVGRL